MADNKVNAPAGFGGLMNYGEEFDSKINLKPEHVIILVIGIIALRIVLPFIFG